MRKREVWTFVWKDFIESPAWIVLDWFMNTVPWFNWWWIALQKAVEQTKEMRILRALELLELFADKDFQEDFLKSDQAVDWFWQCYEAIIRERNEEKRKNIKNIFLWFIKLTEEEKKEFELERILNSLNLISPNGLKILGHYEWAKRHVLSKTFHDKAAHKKAILSASQIRDWTPSQQNETFKELEYLNLIYQNSSQISLTWFWEQIILYIKEPNET